VAMSKAEIEDDEEQEKIAHLNDTVRAKPEDGFRRKGKGNSGDEQERACDQQAARDQDHKRADSTDSDEKTADG
jgi:hypothetical protein